jgi:hypothetical protein
MKRINPLAVVDAYIATGMYPAFKKWGTRDLSGGCGLSALGKSTGCYKHPCSNGSKVEHYATEMGLEFDYVNGFIAGFDSRPLMQTFYSVTDHSAFIQGQRDGWDTRALVKAHFAKSKPAAVTANPAQELVHAH